MSTNSSGFNDTAPTSSVVYCWYRLQILMMDQSDGLLFCRKKGYSKFGNIKEMGMLWNFYLFRFKPAFIMLNLKIAQLNYTMSDNEGRLTCKPSK